MAAIPNIKRRLIRALALTTPLVAIEMSRHLLHVPTLPHDQAVIWQWTMAVLTGIEIGRASCRERVFLTV